MDSEKRKELLRERNKLSKEVEELSRIGKDNLTYQQCVSINNLLKIKRQKYKMICAVLKGLEDGRRNRISNKKTR